MSTLTAVDARLPARATVRRGAPPVLANTTPSATIGAAKTVIAKTADEVWDMARHDDVRELELATAGRVDRDRLKPPTTTNDTRFPSRAYGQRNNGIL